MSTVSQLSTNYTKLSDSRRNSEVPNAALEMNINRPRYDIQGKDANENREVVLYDHFSGDNSGLKFIIKFRKKTC